jgi:hypothetical protein
MCQPLPPPHSFNIHSRVSRRRQVIGKYRILFSHSFAVLDGLSESPPARAALAQADRRIEGLLRHGGDAGELKTRSGAVPIRPAAFVRVLRD